VPSILLGLVVLRYLTERPSEAHWLSSEQRAWLVARLDRDASAVHMVHGLSALRGLAHPLIWLAALPQLLVTTAGYAYLF